MKKIIILLCLVFLTGCAQVQRYFLSDAKRPERNVMADSVADVVLTELEFDQLIPELKETEKYSLGAFYSDGKKLYFSLNQQVKPETGKTVSIGVYAYDLDAKTMETLYTIPVLDEFFVQSIMTIDSKLILSGGYPFKVQGKRTFEISWIHDLEKTKIAENNLDKFRDIPSLHKVDESTIAYVEELTFRLGNRDITRISLNRMTADFMVFSTDLFEYEPPVMDSKEQVMISESTIVVQDGYFAFAYERDSAGWIGRWKLDTSTMLVEVFEPIKIGKSRSPRSMMFIDDHWFVSSADSFDFHPWELHVFDDLGNEVAMQIDGTGSMMFVYPVNIGKTGLFSGAFDFDRSKPVTDRFYLGNIEKNTVIYQRIDELIYGNFVTEIQEGVYLVKGKKDYGSEHHYYILKI